jgi:hypothetical protein
MLVVVPATALVTVRAVIILARDRSGGVRLPVPVGNLHADAAAPFASDTKVKQIQNGEPVSTTLCVLYLRFGRQLCKLNRRQGISGESFAPAAQVLLGKWAARGCDPKVLAEVRKDIFDIDAPA